MEHIGQVIKQELERQERTVVWLARKLSCDRSNIYRIFQKESIDTNLLVRISVILQYDFLQVFLTVYVYNSTNRNKLVELQMYILFYKDKE